MRKIMYAIVTAFVLATGIGMAAASIPASADTAQCAANSSTHWSGGVKVTANFCDSQEIMTSGVNLDLSVPNKVAAYSRLTFKAANTTNPQEDWLNYEPNATTTNKVFEYAPRGNASNLCMAVSNNGRLPVLKTCNGGLAQQWTAIDNGDGTFQWASASNGLAVSDPNLLAFTRATLVNTGSAFTYVQ